MSVELRERPRSTVHGTVTDATGEPVEGAEVTLFHQRLRTCDHLADGTSGDDGRYRLEFAPPDDAPGRVLVAAEARGERLSAPIESAPTPISTGLVINLAAPLDDPSTDGALLRSVTPLLNGLSCSTSWRTPRTRTSRSWPVPPAEARSRSCSSRWQAGLRMTSRCLPQPGYAFVAARVPASLPISLLDASHNFSLIDALVNRVGALIAGLDAAQQTRTLTAAVPQNLVGPDIGMQIPDLVTQLQA